MNVRPFFHFYNVARFCINSSIMLFFVYTGIRSQSKPQDIMHEVFRAMKALNFVSIHCLTKLGHHVKSKQKTCVTVLFFQQTLSEFVSDR